MTKKSATDYYLEIFSDVEAGKTDLNYEYSDIRSKYLNEMVISLYLEGIRASDMNHASYLDLFMTQFGRDYYQRLKNDKSIIYSIKCFFLRALEVAIIPILVSVITSVITVFILKKFGLE